MPRSAHKEIGSSAALKLSLALAGVFASCAWAQGTAAADAQLPALAEQAARLEINATTLARPDGAESAFSGNRVDMSLLPPRSSAIGLAVGMSGFAAPSAPAGAGLAPAATPSVDVGLHWRHTLDSNYRIDVRAWRRVPSAADTLLDQARAPTYGARIEVPLAPQAPGKTDFALDKGILGFQLENGGRISIRRKHGGPMVYYRVKF